MLVMNNMKMATVNPLMQGTDVANIDIPLF